MEQPTILSSHGTKQSRDSPSEKSLYAEIGRKSRRVDQTPPIKIRKFSRIEKARSYIEVVEIKKHCIIRRIIKKDLIITHGPSCQ